MATGCQQLITESKTNAGSAMKELRILGPQTRDVSQHNPLWQKRMTFNIRRAKEK